MTGLGGLLSDVSAPVKWVADDPRGVEPSVGGNKVSLTCR
jgi:hypothetical protein